MDAELRSLEDKVNQVVTLAQRLRSDNHDLRQQLAAALNDNKQLTEKIGVAATRLESLLTQIPDEAL
jgi:cell division protein ZapB